MSENQLSDYRVTDPYTGRVVKEFPTATDDEVRAAIERAHAAYEPWRSTPLAERAAIYLLYTSPSPRD